MADKVSLFMYKIGASVSFTNFTFYSSLCVSNALPFAAVVAVVLAFLVKNYVMPGKFIYVNEVREPGERRRIFGMEFAK